MKTLKFASEIYWPLVYNILGDYSMLLYRMNISHKMKHLFPPFILYYQQILMSWLSNLFFVHLPFHEIFFAISHSNFSGTLSLVQKKNDSFLLFDICSKLRQEIVFLMIVVPVQLHMRCNFFGWLYFDNLILNHF